MKNVQVIDGAMNSVFEIYRIPDDLFEVMFPDGNEIAFLDEAEEALRGRGDAVWDLVYRDPVDKKRVDGIHGTLHLPGSNCRREYFPHRRESDHRLNVDPFEDDLAEENGSSGDRG